MAARRPARGSGGDLPDHGNRNERDAARGEIQALLESPELRRIFDEEPAKIRSGKAQRGTAERSGDSPIDRGARPAASRGSRRRRILIGLAPLYLGGVILFFEAVREPSMFLQAFGTPSMAEATPARAGAAVIAAAEPDEAPEKQMQPEATVADLDAELAGAVEETKGAAAPHAVGSTERVSKVSLTDTRPATATEKSVIDEKTVVTDKAAIDLAKRAAGRGVPEAEAALESSPIQDSEGGGAVDRAAAADRVEMAFEGSPAEVAHETFSVAENRPMAGLDYPDPRAGAVQVVAPVDPAAAEAAEEALRLSRADRREVQRRLRFASSDPELIDGIFGPTTRTAIAAWQERAGLPPTGFMDEPGMARLVEQTADEYRAWRVAERARAREREAKSAVVASSAPPVPRATRNDPCSRSRSGEIAFGRDVGCNFRAFGENFKRDFRELKGDIRQLFD